MAEWAKTGSPVSILEQKGDGPKILPDRVGALGWVKLAELCHP
jgi:hypothetical protein